ncbi:hypothetical protein [Streptomyces sp. NPDC048637]|uniref:hypothetical protein n=1 Tax=Streptomyces sp. NPDC048637 TaxID=3155636 RepID=UPI00341DF26F
MTDPASESTDHGTGANATGNAAWNAAGNPGAPPPLPPPFPPGTVPGGRPAAAAPQAVPTTPEEALEIGRGHYPPVGSPGGPASLFVHEFDLGYLIHAGWPAPADPTAPPANPGGSHLVISKTDGEVTAVPNFPPESAVEVYRQWHRPSTSP